MAAMGVDPRDHYPLLLRALCDRGPRLQPDNLIITKVQSGYSTMTYRDHQLRSERLASALARWGVRVGDSVGTLMWNTVAHFHCYHAISCMGAILHTLNLRLGPKDLGFIIQHAADRVICSDGDLLKLLAAVAPADLAGVEQLVVFGMDGMPGEWQLPPQLSAKPAVDFEAFLTTGADRFDWPELPETTTHALCYTSGTTGHPKGAAYSHRSTFLHTLSTVGVDALGLSGTNVVMPFVPMFHVLSWGVPFSALMLGCRVVFTSRFMDPATLLNSMLDWGVEVSTGVPTVWQGVRNEVEKRGAEKVRASLKLRMLTCGGAAPPQEMMAWYGKALGVQFFQGWGMTETNPLGSLGKPLAKYKDLERSPEERFGNIAKAGLPLPGVEVRIANPENMDEDMPQGKPGELLVRGPWIIGAYFKTDAKDKFHKGWLVTGDVAKIDEEGAIVISDRSKDVIKSGGEWISSIDLENHIASMPEIALAAVVAVPHPRWDERPVAITVLAPEAGEAGLRGKMEEHCATSFAKFQIPDDVLVWKDIPLTSTGKIDKKEIRARLEKSGYSLPKSKL